MLKEGKIKRSVPLVIPNRYSKTRKQKSFKKNTYTMLTFIETYTLLRNVLRPAAFSAATGVVGFLVAVPVFDFAAEAARFRDEAVFFDATLVEAGWAAFLVPVPVRGLATVVPEDVAEETVPVLPLRSC